MSLLYGAPDLAPPRYDLALYAPRLVGVSAREVTLAPEAAGAASGTRTSSGEKLFWLVLVGAVVALLVLLARLLRKTGP